MDHLFNSVYKNRKVLVTGHTGFKGSWLAYWLYQMGATVTGYSNMIPTKPCHFELLDLPVNHLLGDIRDKERLDQVMEEVQPEIIFHLAAQPLVRLSYQQPAETFETNVMGTVNVFESARKCKSVRAIVNITSDKAYENLETDHAYSETDRMGGYDPYSASKGCAELVVNSYQNSFFNLNQWGKEHTILLASARAGNVIGGGDWALDRLIPDIIKNSISGKPVHIRHPKATRPWQHVLEPLSGYLLLGQHLLKENKSTASGWNFGPLKNETLRVEEVLERFSTVWPQLNYVIDDSNNELHEAHLLRLDCSKANSQLDWVPVWSMDEGIEKTANWYKEYYQHSKIHTGADLENYIQDAIKKQLPWTQ